MGLGIALALGCSSSAPPSSAEAVTDSNLNDQTLDGQPLADTAAGIVGGTPANPKDPGFYSTLGLVDASGVTYCTGVLIAPQFALTAAHCVEGYEETDTQIIFAALPNKRFEIEAFILHPGYMTLDSILAKVKNNLKGALQINNNDIALVMLKEKAPVEAVVANLPATPYLVGKSVNVRTYGYGQISEKAKTDGQLRQVDLKGTVLASDTARLNFDQRNGRGICNGDSGGPSYIYSSRSQPVVVALNSIGIRREFFGFSFGDICKNQAVALQVAPYRDWIISARDRALENNCMKDENFRKKISLQLNLDLIKPYRMVRQTEISFYGARAWNYQLVAFNTQGAIVLATVTASRTCDNWTENN